VRRQTLRRTRVELHHSFTRDGREWIKEMWQAAEGILARLTELSPLTTVLGSGSADSYAAAEHLEGDEIRHAFFDVIMAGYASRIVLAKAMEQPDLDLSSLPLDAPVDVARIARDTAAVGELIRSVRTIAMADFDSVMTLPPEVWGGYVAMATMRVQHDLASSTLTWRDLSRERIDQLLRYGYVLRSLDEMLDEEPELREDQS
jgi:hypothetical protein